MGQDKAKESLTNHNPESKGKLIVSLRATDPRRTTTRKKGVGPWEQRAREDERKPRMINQNRPGRGQCEKITEMVSFAMYPVMNFTGRPESRKTMFAEQMNNQWKRWGRSPAPGGWSFQAPLLNSLPVWELWLTSQQAQVPYQCQSLINRSQCRVLQAFKVNYSSFFPGQKRPTAPTDSLSRTVLFDKWRTGFSSQSAGLAPAWSQAVFVVPLIKYKAEWRTNHCFTWREQASTLRQLWGCLPSTGKLGIGKKKKTTF